jgi:hypothetical protein
MWESDIPGKGVTGTNGSESSNGSTTMASFSTAFTFSMATLAINALKRNGVVLDYTNGEDGLVFFFSVDNTQASTHKALLVPVCAVSVMWKMMGRLQP